MSGAWATPAPADAQRHPPEVVFAAGLRNHHVSNTAYPIAHERTWRPYRVHPSRTDEVATRAWDGVDEPCLYLHVPFCETRCSFCEYTVTKREEHAQADEYVACLAREVDLWADAIGGRRRLLGLDIGGGTPAFLPGDDILRLMDAVRRRFDIAPGVVASIETTPRIAAAAPGKLLAYRRAGLGRISMGIQVIEPDLLKVLGRETNGIETHARAVANIRDAGFTSFNVDLMYGFAGQSLESWEATLAHAISLGPEAITLYRMRYKLTRISHQAGSVTLEQVRPQQRLAKKLLEQAGYHANPGKTTYSRIEGDPGTSSYLTRRVVDGTPYLGMGLGAQSFSPTTISYAAGAAGKNLAPYHALVHDGRLPLQDLYHLPLQHLAGKFCAVSFYFGEIDRHAFAARFGVPLELHYRDEIDFLTDAGYMEWTDRALRLTPEGVDVQNGVIALFFAPSIQAHLVERDADAASDFHRQRQAALRVAGESVASAHA